MTDIESGKNSNPSSPLSPDGTTLPAGESLQKYFEKMPNGVAYCKMLYQDGKPTDFVFLYTNPAFHEQSGLGVVTGKRVSDIIPGLLESNPELFKIYGSVADGGGPENFEIFLTSLQQWFSVYVYSPEPEHFIATFNVLKQRNSAELSLVASEQLYRGLLEDQTETICRFKADGTIIYVNHAFCALFGKSRESLIGQTWHPRAFSEDLSIINEKLNSLTPDNPVVTNVIKLRSTSLNMI